MAVPGALLLYRGKMTGRLDPHRWGQSLFYFGNPHTGNGTGGQ
jgi:hypothetical protein